MNDAEFCGYLSSVADEIKSATGERRLTIGWQFLEKMGLDEFSGCDIDLVPILEQIPPGSDFVDVQSYLQHTLVESLFSNISSGGTSILLDTEKMRNTPAEVLIPLIERQRRDELRRARFRLNGRELVQCDVYMNELRSLFVPDCENYVNLEDIWMTAMGFRVLSDLGFGLFTNDRGLKQVRKLLGIAGLGQKELLYNQLPSDSKMSPAMKSIINKQICDDC
ncbi:MAG: hypothetical protein ACFFED_08895 [Candidatus Thorarchaeota archaeon]